MNSHIVISKNLQNVLETKKMELKGKNTRLFIKDEFLIDDAKEVINESYISSEDKKYILICAQRINIYAQNRLLKILEEPPKNIVFIIITESKSSLLPTIRSRLPIFIQKEKREKKLDIQKLGNFDNNAIYEFLKEYSKINKEEALNLIADIFEYAQKIGIRFNKKVLDAFSMAPRLILLNEKPAIVFAYLLIIIQSAKNTKNRF